MTWEKVNNDLQQQHVGGNSSTSKIVTDAVWSYRAFNATRSRSIAAEPVQTSRPFTLPQDAAC